MDPLSASEVRVLGSLLEKEITTPEYYPLTLNALLNACNQKSNRDPVVSYDEDTVATALDSLRAKHLAVVVSGSGHRVEKYGHRFSEVLNLGRRELALLCVLMLRGRQTVGELKDRSERLHNFTDLEEVESCLRGLMEREPPLVTKLAKAPGTKEPRYAHLLSGNVADEQEAELPRPTPREDRITAIEAEVAQLRAEIDRLRQTFDEFRKQFE
ncbi:MAG TPA: YceH family protein [Bryobacteraceae bacterium]|nr:YceH family protein [Bryobacteraceae bacterium]